jgi:lysophospholipase L1-like esterase
VKSNRVTLGLAGASLVLATLVALRVNAEQFNGPSPWLFLSAVASMSLLLVEFALRAVESSAAIRARVRLLVATTLVMLFAAEAALRYGTPRWATYTERNGGAYFRQFRGERSWFRSYMPGGPYRFTTSEYSHYRDINSLGLTGPEFIREKAPGEYRILALGDSFTEGLGTPADTTWVKVTEARLQERYPERRITSINAGMSGNDVFTEQMMLKEKLLPFNPDLIILALNTSDMNEIIVRGGSERFQPDGTVAYRNGPRWEPLYGLSYIWRAIAHQVLGYNFLLIKSRDMPARGREAAGLLDAALKSIRDLCRAKGIDFIVISHPHANEVMQGEYGDAAYNDLVASIEGERDLQFVDLLKYYTQHGIITAETAQQFYWPIDLHHNTKGYQIMGEAIAKQVVELGLGPDH